MIESLDLRLGFIAYFLYLLGLNGLHVVARVTLLLILFTPLDALYRQNDHCHEANAIGKPHIKTIASHIDKITPTLEKHFPLPKIKIKNYFSLLAKLFSHGRLLSSFSNSTR